METENITTEEKENMPDNQDQVSEKKRGALNHYKTQLSELKKQNEELMRQITEKEVSQLKEKENWKQLYETEFQKRQSYEGEIKNLKTSFVDNLMRKEIESVAMEMGIRKEALADLDLLDRGMIEVETTSSGKINFHNTKEFIQSLKQTRPYWFIENRDPKINTSNPKYIPDKVMSYDEILELEKKDPTRYKIEMNKLLDKRREQ